MARNKCREHILETATELFARKGFHATGIDSVTKEADVARMSLYNNFESKDDLIQAVLERQNNLMEQWLNSIIETPIPPESRFDHLFDALGERWNSEHFTGCPFINASAEFSCPEHPVHRTVKEHKLRVEGLLVVLLSQMDLNSPDAAAAQIILLIDGGAVRAQTTGDILAHEKARTAAWTIVAAHKKGQLQPD